MYSIKIQNLLLNIKFASSQTLPYGLTVVAAAALDLGRGERACAQVLGQMGIRVVFQNQCHAHWPAHHHAHHLSHIRVVERSQKLWSDTKNNNNF